MTLACATMAIEPRHPTGAINIGAAPVSAPTSNRTGKRHEFVLIPTRAVQQHQRSFGGIGAGNEVVDVGHGDLWHP